MAIINGEQATWKWHANFKNYWMFYGDSCYSPLYYNLKRKTILLDCSPGSRSTETEKNRAASFWMGYFPYIKTPTKNVLSEGKEFLIGYFLYIINKNRDKSTFHETVLWQLGYAQLLDTERALVFNAKSAKTSGWRYRQSMYRISWSTIWNWPHWTVVHNRVKAKKQVGLKCRKLLFFFIYLSICRIYSGAVLSKHMLRKYFTAEILGP